MYDQKCAKREHEKDTFNAFSDAYQLPFFPRRLSQQ